MQSRTCTLTSCPPCLSYIWSTQPWKQKGFLGDRGEKSLFRFSVCQTQNIHTRCHAGTMTTTVHTQVHETAGAKWKCISKRKRWLSGDGWWKKVAAAETERDWEARRLFKTRPFLQYTDLLHQHDDVCLSVCARVNVRECFCTVPLSCPRVVNMKLQLVSVVWHKVTKGNSYCFVFLYKSNKQSVTYNLVGFRAAGRRINLPLARARIAVFPFQVYARLS